MPRVTYEYLKNLDPAEIGKMNTSEVKNILEQARKKYDTRVKQFDKQGRFFYSYARTKMDDYYNDVGKPSINRISRNRAMAELFRLQEFFSAKTSDVKGAREVNKEQDRRIFGVDKNGKPLGKMTSAERKAYWDLYDEFVNQNPTYEYIYGSNRIQQYLGDYILNAPEDGKGTVDSNPDIIANLRNALSKNVRPSEVDNDIRNSVVYRKPRLNRKRGIS